MNNKQHVSLRILANFTSKVESIFHISDHLGYSSLKSKRTLRSQILTNHNVTQNSSRWLDGNVTIHPSSDPIVFFPPRFSFVSLLSSPIRITHCSVPFFSTPPPLSLSFLPTLGRVTRAYSSRG